MRDAVFLLYAKVQCVRVNEPRKIRVFKACYEAVKRRSRFIWCSGEIHVATTSLAASQGLRAPFGKVRDPFSTGNINGDVSRRSRRADREDLPRPLGESSLLLPPLPSFYI